MFGGRSIQLARPFGIRVGVDASWFLVLFLIIWSLSDAFGDVYPGDDTKAFALATVSALAFFGSVVLHELGHALVAMRNGIGIAGIDLFLFGGVAKMQRDTDSPGLEFRVAVAGPVVTLAIALLCAAVNLALYGWHGAVELIGFEEGDPAAQAMLGYLCGVNLALLVFNLIPGFPLDGGRIARAAAWARTGDRARATRFAARLGRFFAYAMSGLGLFLLVNGLLIAGIWLVFIGLFLGQAARSAEFQSAIASRIEGVRVADVMDAEPVAVASTAPLDRALEDFFLRYGWPWFPVTDPGGRFVGVVARNRVEGVPEEQRRDFTVDEVMVSADSGSFGVRTDEPLDSLLGSDGLKRLGAVMAVDADGRLRGVVTLQQVRRALEQAAAPA